MDLEDLVHLVDLGLVLGSFVLLHSDLGSLKVFILSPLFSET